MFEYKEEPLMEKYRVIEGVDKLEIKKYKVQKSCISEYGIRWETVQIFDSEDGALGFYNSLTQHKITEEGDRILAQN